MADNLLAIMHARSFDVIYPTNTVWQPTSRPPSESIASSKMLGSSTKKGYQFDMEVYPFHDHCILAGDIMWTVALDSDEKISLDQ